MHTEEGLCEYDLVVVLARPEANLKILWYDDVKGRCIDMAWM